MNRIREILFGCLCLAVAWPSSVSASPLPVGPKDIESIRFEQRIGQMLPLSARLVDDHGAERPLGSWVGGKPLILVFSYYRCPNLCTLVLNGLVQALRELPDRLAQDYLVLSISIDPTERPALALAKKRSYLARLGVSEQRSSGAAWSFTVGKSEDETRSIASAAGFRYRFDPVSREYEHPSGIIVITPDGRVSQYLFGIRFDPTALHRALSQARLGKKGSWAEEILLFCFHYDPKLSSHGPLILRSIRATALAGMIGMAIFFIWLSRGRSRQEPGA